MPTGEGVKSTRTGPSAFAAVTGLHAPTADIRWQPTVAFGTKNAPLGISHEPAVNVLDLIAAISSSNYR